jgi:ubiquinone/menaquinone biosynthesis C-methylase UbiE
MEEWLTEHGSVFLREIGIEKGQHVLDFGCGEGCYTIPAAIVVEAQGKVYAVDKDKAVLSKLSKQAKSMGLTNIALIHSKTDLKVDLGDECVDVALLYDVLHYVEYRPELYEEMYRILKKNGLLSVYPKHCKSDFPMWSLANLEMREVIEEIERAKFRFEEKVWKQLMHFGGYTRGYILHFRKG